MAKDPDKRKKKDSDDSSRKGKKGNGSGPSGSGKRGSDPGKIFKIIDDVNQIAELEEKAEFKEYFDEKENIRFAYPKNWFVQESFWASDVKSFIVNSPEGYFWLLAIFPKGTDPDEAAKEVLHSMKGEYERLEDIPAKRLIAGRHLTGYEMNFFYLDLVNTAIVLGFEERDRTYVIFWQNCDRLVVTGDPYDYEDVFEAITYTLLSHFDGEDPRIDA